MLDTLPAGRCLRAQGSYFAGEIKTADVARALKFRARTSLVRTSAFRPNRKAPASS